MSNKKHFQTNFDNEEFILKYVHSFDPEMCLILSDSEDSANYQETVNVLQSLFSDDYLENWKNNSQSSLPPDFLNEKNFLMMEMMRIDDHSSDGKANRTLAKEKQMHKELEPILGMFPNLEQVICIPATDLPTDVDHNYVNYYRSFQRTLRKHSSKIQKYRTNHPGLKLIFLVMDETSGVYFESQEGSKGRLHYPFFDNKFISEFIDKDIDYLIWAMPYNHFDTIEHHKELPNLVIFDVKHLKNGEMMQYIDYDESKMKSSEK